MKIFRSKDGPFRHRILYELAEMDQICSEALLKTSLLPAAPSPIKVDRFLEKYFQVPVLYEDLGDAMLGCTIFNRDGAVAGFMISTAIEESGTKSAERRARSTLAHEGGHGLLHPLLFMEDKTPSFFSEPKDASPRIMCRPQDVAPASGQIPYNGRWWEWQANRAIAGLLLPKKLVTLAIEHLLQDDKVAPFLPESKRSEAEHLTAETFDVNPVVARIRLEEMYPRTSQMSL